MSGGYLPRTLVRDVFVAEHNSSRTLQEKRRRGERNSLLRQPVGRQEAEHRAFQLQRRISASSELHAIVALES